MPDFNYCPMTTTRARMYRVPAGANPRLGTGFQISNESRKPSYQPSTSARDLHTSPPRERNRKSKIEKCHSNSAWTENQGDYKKIVASAPVDLQQLTKTDFPIEPVSRRSFWT